MRRFREEAGLTLEKLAFESDLGSKGHLSDLERGLLRPTISTLQVLADRLEVLLLDLVTNPDADTRQQLVDLTRRLSPSGLRRVLREARRVLAEEQQRQRS